MRNVCHLKVKLLFALFGFIGTFQLLVVHSIKDKGFSYGLYLDNDRNLYHKLFGMSEVILVLRLFLLSLNYLQSARNLAEVSKIWEKLNRNVPFFEDNILFHRYDCISSCRVTMTH